MERSDYSAIDNLELMPLPSCRMLPDTTIVDVNDAYCQLLDTAKSDLIGRLATDFTSPDSAKNLRWGIAHMTPENPSLLNGKQLLHANGASKWMIWNDTGIFDNDGTLRYVWAFSWDVTDDRRYSDALEKLIRLTNDHTLDADCMLNGILEIGCDYFRAIRGVIAHRNEQGFTPVYGHGAELRVGIGETLAYDETYASLVYEEKTIVAINDMSQSPYTDWKVYKERPVKRLISSKISVDGTDYGSIVFVSSEASGVKFSAEDIQLCKILSQWVSLTLSRNKKIENISNSEEIYRQIFDYAPIMMYTLNKGRIITNVNNKWLETIGCEKDAVVGKDITAFMTPESAAAAKIEIQRSFNKSVSGFQRNFKSKNGSIVETELATLDAKGTMPDEALAVVTDVTDRNRAQRSLQRGNAELMRANAGLKRFNAVAAHDLQEPLRKIGIYGGILEEALISSANTEVLECLHVMVRSSQRLSKLVRDLLTYSQQSEHDYSRERIDLGTVLSAVLTDMDLKIRETNTQITIDPLPPLRGDRVPIERLFHNLINNALTYNRLGHPPEIHIFANTRDNGDVDVTVRDNGMGVPPEAVEKIFEPFARLQPTAFSGTGIGLAMCKSIAEGHGWSIRAAARQDQPGSDFILTVPRKSVLKPAASRMAD